MTSAGTSRGAPQRGEPKWADSARVRKFSDDSHAIVVPSVPGIERKAEGASIDAEAVPKPSLGWVAGVRRKPVMPCAERTARRVAWASAERRPFQIGVLLVSRLDRIQSDEARRERRWTFDEAGDAGQTAEPAQIARISGVGRALAGDHWRHAGRTSLLRPLARRALDAPDFCNLGPFLGREAHDATPRGSAVVPRLGGTPSFTAPSSLALAVSSSFLSARASPGERAQKSLSAWRLMLSNQSSSAED